MEVIFVSRNEGEDLKMAEVVVFLDLKYPFLDQPPRLIDFGKEMDASELRSLQMSESMQQLVNDLAATESVLLFSVQIHTSHC
ncbi:hypothetical protein NC653_015560 [Populus alba x Populus x berolinensis]|uniref:Uncharacterized protein n=1 Tax=Populus alba x Populus x berolinensis TaxID=444605 RepID=A0AAD6VY91_9ROSI|nr:hypothetical protein NC653_015560 [Populus alba x Populus x berolinensis]